MGQINILNDAGTAKLSLQFTGTTNKSLNSELLSSITSDVQTQLDSKVSKSGGTMTGNLTVPEWIQLYTDGVNGTQRHGRISGTASTNMPYAGGVKLEYYNFNGTAYQFYDGLNVDGMGRVTMPNQPSFQTIETSFSVPAYTQKAVIASTFFNTGSHYNTSTGKFTAPVAGLYSFSLVVTPSSATSSPAIWIRVNGSGGTGRYGICLAYNTSYNGVTASALIKLNANDYVEGIVEEWNGGTGLTIWSASFNGCLIS